MSRARYIDLNEEDRVWFDTRLNGERARTDHLELLALVEDIDLDDLLDGHVTQRDVIHRLRDALGQNTIPDEVFTRREEWRAARRIAPKCRICDAKENSTKHHFINKWILRELKEYAKKWSDRTINTIPICLDCHRDLHMRTGPAKSIVEYLTSSEREFAYAALDALCEQAPKLALILARGDDSVYESRLLKDFILGLFDPSEAVPINPSEVREAVFSR